MEVKSQDLISDSNPHSYIWDEGTKIYFLMLNLKNNENDAIFDDIWKKSED